MYQVYIWLPSGCDIVNIGYTGCKFAYSDINFHFSKIGSYVFFCILEFFAPCLKIFMDGHAIFNEALVRTISTIIIAEEHQVSDALHWVVYNQALLPLPSSMQASAPSLGSNSSNPGELRPRFFTYWIYSSRSLTSLWSSLGRFHPMCWALPFYPFWNSGLSNLSCSLLLLQWVHSLLHWVRDFWLNGGTMLCFSSNFRTSGIWPQILHLYPLLGCQGVAPLWECLAFSQPLSQRWLRLLLCCK